MQRRIRQPLDNKYAAVRNEKQLRGGGGGGGSHAESGDASSAAARRPPFCEQEARSVCSAARHT